MQERRRDYAVSASMMQVLSYPQAFQLEYYLDAGISNFSRLLKICKCLISFKSCLVFRDPDRVESENLHSFDDLLWRGRKGEETIEKEEGEGEERYLSGKM